ncbi:polyprenyl synthetase family protein [Oceanobacillus rekensis]|uniref:polyprenyl synthetase family protein n=1 Tax=Oceanobacillus rekensis TaxID=937927 RepID=UPI000B444B06|nr:polyprenyl synthetase family protein [Oceanobacillus rekensis]
MSEKLLIDADRCYLLAEQKAADYFKLLSIELKGKSYAKNLTRDIQKWKHHHIHQPSLFSFLSRRRGKVDALGYRPYIQWLNSSGKLDNYLDRSISYIFMRDLGKALDDPNTQNRIEQVVASLKSHLTQSTANQGDMNETFSMAGLYRIAQKEGIESAMIWVMDKLKIVAAHIPIGMDADEAQRKLIKIIAGVLMHELEELSDEQSLEVRSKQLDKAIRLGYSYGLTYPFIDDLLDSGVLSVEEKERYSNLIRTALTTGNVPELEGWTGDNAELIHYIHGELKSAFMYIKTHQLPETLQSFFEQSYIFFHSQEKDRVKDLSNANYTNEELYIPIILKSAASRLIVRTVIRAPEDNEFEDLTFYYGIYNQLADDFADMFDDMKAGAVTPYTYYLTYRKNRKDLINPYELYWTVISHLIHEVYRSDTKTCEVILNRAINGLKRFKEKQGTNKYNEVMDKFASFNPNFNRLIQQMVRKADDVDFFDKLLRDHIISNLKNNRKEQEEFLGTVESVYHQINSVLPIYNSNHDTSIKVPLNDAANYSLEGDGKRIRPIMAWFMSVHVYGLDKTKIIPLLKSLEYMHTASLIFDDLPSQDNASMRRGRPTLHEVYNSATAELTGLFLTQKAYEEQASLTSFDAKRVLQLIHYSAQAAADMCMGQTMDLDSKGKQLTLDQLNTMCFYKTGLAFEASLMMPAIIAGAEKSEMEALKKLAYHMGIAFQIKDDLLDVEGDLESLGKIPLKDLENNRATFVSILGVEGARIEMWEHYCFGMEVLQEMPTSISFLKHFMNYIVNRDN